MGGGGGESRHPRAAPRESILPRGGAPPPAGGGGRAASVDRGNRTRGVGAGERPAARRRGRGRIRRALRGNRLLVRAASAVARGGADLSRRGRGRHGYERGGRRGAAGSSRR